MAMQDRSIVCRDCGADFVFTAGEQEFYASKGLQNDPVRCPDCRKARNSARTTLESSSGYVLYGGAASFGGRTPKQMHPARLTAPNASVWAGAGTPALPCKTSETATEI